MNLESFASFKQFYFSDVPLIYYSVAINESEEKFRIVFYLFSAITSIVAPSSSSNFPANLIC